ncbi:MAG: SRPBCC family protein [Actinomycetota bacterium]
MSAHEIRYQVSVDAPAEKVWEALADFGNVSRYNPGVVHSHATSTEPSGLGATRHCSLALFGASVEERIVGWTESELLAIEIYDAKRFPVIKNAGATFKLDGTGDETVVEGAFSYDVKYGPIGSAMNALSLRKQTDRAWRLFLAGLKKHVETGETIDGDTRVPVESVVAS